MDLQQIQLKLSEVLPGKRYKHSMDVSETAGILAKCFGENVYLAKVAGLLHDCAREIPKNHLLQAAEAFDIVVDDIQRGEPVLLHAPLGAKFARLKYGIDSAEICRAILLHTVGSPNMNGLDKIIYLADFIEPGRDFPGVDKLRNLAKKNLDVAVLTAFNHSIQYIISENKLLHPDTVAARNDLILKLAKAESDQE